MNELKQFLKSVPGALWWIVGGFFLLICLLPIVFTQIPGIVSFAETGQIGDTIGGTMGPFIAIVAALLTFVAFWAQYEANKELIKENRRNHFENRFYKMLDMHLESVEHIRKLSETGSYSVFSIWCDDILNTFTSLMADADFGGFLSLIRQNYNNEPSQKSFLEFLRDIELSQPLREEVMFEIAYSVFFLGETSTLKYGDKVQTANVQKLAGLILPYRNIKGKDSKTSHSMNEILGRYYRHLFQIVTFVDKQEDDLYEGASWKSDLIGLLRSQMSDYEQVLLYYNSQSSLGAAWNEHHYIEKYQLIRNIPFFNIHGGAGVPPIRKYRDAIAAAESQGKAFFERG